MVSRCRTFFSPRRSRLASSAQTCARLVGVPTCPQLDVEARRPTQYLTCLRSVVKLHCSRFGCMRALVQSTQQSIDTAITNGTCVVHTLPQSRNEAKRPKHVSDQTSNTKVQRGLPPIARSICQNVHVRQAPPELANRLVQVSRHSR